MENEIWKDIPGKIGYQASNLGRIKSLDRVIFNNGNMSPARIKGAILKNCRAKSGYLVVNIGRKTNYVHRLVAAAFIGEIGFKMTINHINGDKENNTELNLEILNYSDNHLHAFNVLKRKPTCLGKLNTNASKAVVQMDIEGKIINTYPSAREIERVLGFSYKQISSCCNGKNKTHKGYKWSFETINA